MHFLIRQFQLYLAAERARLRRKIRSAAANVVLFIATCIVFVFALGFGLFGVYHYLAQTWTPIAAGLSIAGLLLVVAGVLLLVVFHQSPPGGQQNQDYYPPPDSPAQGGTDSALRLGEAVGETVKRGTGSGDLAIAALLVGIVIGASPALRGNRRRKGERRRSTDER